MKSDGIVYAFINGQWEGIASAGRNVVTYNPTQSAALTALETGQVPVGLTPKEEREVKNLLGDYWDQLEDVPVTANKESQDDIQDPFTIKLEQAKAAFTARKLAEATAEMVETKEIESLDSGNLNVEPKENEESV